MAVAGPRRAILEPSFLPQSRLIFSAFTSAPSYQRKLLINKTVASLIASGIWNKLDALGFMAAADSQAARINWIAPGTYTLVAQNSPTFTTDRGYMGDGSSAYLKTGVDPSTTAKFQQNSGSFGLYARQVDTLGSYRRDGGSENGATSLLSLNSGSAADKIGFNNNAASGATYYYGSNPTGLRAVNRSSSSAFDCYVAGSSVQNKVASSVAPSAYEIYLLAANVSGSANNISNAQISFWFVGASLSAAQHASLNTIVNTYLAAVGAV